jgi:hypothetical protein
MELIRRLISLGVESGSLRYGENWNYEVTFLLASGATNMEIYIYLCFKNYFFLQLLIGILFVKITQIHFDR